MTCYHEEAARQRATAAAKTSAGSASAQPAAAAETATQANPQAEGSKGQTPAAKRADRPGFFSRIFRAVRADDNALQLEIEAKGLKAPRVTPDHIDAQIASVHIFRASDAVAGNPGAENLSTLTICCLTLKNGFIVTGESACASPENFDAEIGAKLAFQNARNKIWALEGYQLRTKLTEELAAASALK